MMKQSQREAVDEKRVQSMKQRVRQVIAERVLIPQSAVQDIAPDKERPEETARFVRPCDRPIAFQHLADLNKVVRKKIGVEDCGVSDEGQQEQE